MNEGELRGMIAISEQLRVHAEDRVNQLEQTLRLVEHKLDQFLQGQYNHKPYPSLGATLTEVRRALAGK